MTVQNQTVAYSYTGNGVSTVFNFPSRFLAAGDLQVTLNNVLQIAGYVVAGAGNNAGGTVTFTVPPANGVVVGLVRNPAITQLTDYVNSQTILDVNIEDALDRLTMAMQYVAFNTSTSLHAAIIDTGVDLTIPSKTVRANQLLGFDATGAPIAVLPAVGGVSTFDNIIDATAIGKAIGRAASIAVQTSLDHATAATGTANAIQVSFTPANTAWVDKERFWFTATATNTIAAPTISKDGGVTSKVLTRNGGAALGIGGIVIGTSYEVLYDGVSADVTNLPTDLTNVARTDTVNTFAQSQTFSKAIKTAKGAAVASAATTDIWAGNDGNALHITGTTTITSLGAAAQAGDKRIIIFDGALTLTHNATTLILPSAANIATAAGDRMEVLADTTANMIVTSYVRANGQPVASSVLLGTISTNSGTTATLTNIPTIYKTLAIEIVGVSFATAAILKLGVSNNNGASFGAAQNITASLALATDLFFGFGTLWGIQAADTVLVSQFATGLAVGVGSSISTMFIYASGNGPCNAIQFSGNGATFDAGLIRVYGVA